MNNSTVRRRPHKPTPVSVLATLLWLALETAALAQIKSAASISFQGVLNGADGKPLADGPHTLVFRFYDAAGGGNLIGSAITNRNVPVTGGIVSTPIEVDPATFNGQTRYLGISVDDGLELSPRVLVTAVPYALIAKGVAGDGITSYPGSTAVGIGTASPLTQLHLVGRQTDDAPPFRLDQSRDGVDHGRMLTSPNSGPSGRIYLENNRLSFAAGDGTTPAFQFVQRGDSIEAGMILLSPGSPTSGRIFLENNRLFIGKANFADAIVVNPDGVTDVRVLRIRGGADLAEPFDVTSRCETEIIPGMVTVIDREHDGKLTPCTRAYDTAVAGIISGANGLSPGMLMRAEGDSHADGEHPLAMAGRVGSWVGASLETGGGPVQRGDRLTTSSTPGHAMRVMDGAKAPGAVIGKAMTELADGRGLVLVLVNLQ